MTTPLTLSPAELLQRLADGATLTRETRREWWLQSGGREQLIHPAAPEELRAHGVITLSCYGWCWRINDDGRATLKRFKARERLR